MIVIIAILLAILAWAISARAATLKMYNDKIYEHRSFIQFHRAVSVKHQMQLLDVQNELQKARDELDLVRKQLNIKQQVEIPKAAQKAAIDSLNERQRRFYEDLPNQFTTNEALDIGAKHGYSKRSVYNLLSKRDLFKKLDRAEYTKMEEKEK